MNTKGGENATSSLLRVDSRKVEIGSGNMMANKSEPGGAVIGTKIFTTTNTKVLHIFHKYFVLDKLTFYACNFIVWVAISPEISRLICEA